MLDELTHWLSAPRDPEGLAFDAEFGTETRWHDLGNYEPIRPTVFAAALSAVDLPTETASFVDFGSGKGRAVILAATRPFAGVYGIEHGRSLHARAQANVDAARARGKIVAPVALIHGDATRWTPPDGPLVAFLYNPFGAGDVVRLLPALERPGVRLVYVNPWESAFVAAAGWRCLAAGGKTPWAWGVWRPPG